MTVSISPAAIEQIEAGSWADFEAAATAEAKAALGARELRVGGGVALAMPTDQTGFWSKVVGLGFDEPITVTLLEQITGFYREQGMSRALLQIAPQVLPADWPDMCEKLHISASGSAWVKLVGNLGSITDQVAARGGPAAYLDADLRIEKVSAERAREWALVMREVFGLPLEHQIEMAVGVVGRAGWQTFAV